MSRSCHFWFAHELALPWIALVAKPLENKSRLVCLAPSIGASRLTSRCGRAVPRMCGARSDRSIGHPVCRVRAPVRTSGVSVKSVWLRPVLPAVLDFRGAVLLQGTLIEDRRLSSALDSSAGPCVRTRKLRGGRSSVEGMNEIRQHGIRKPVARPAKAHEWYDTPLLATCALRGDHFCARLSGAPCSLLTTSSITRTG